MSPREIARTVILGSLFIVCVTALSPSGKNVQRHTRVESYTEQQRYKTKCGFLGWKRCTRHRTVTKTRIRTDYRCRSGWVSPDNVHCSKAVCFGQPAGSCANRGTCNSPNVCSCRPGYSRPLCADINECSRGNGGCQHKCTNEPGSFRCSCNSGFGLLPDKKSCKPVCFGQTPGACAHGGECTSPGQCKCPTGYTRPRCDDINECARNNGGCNQVCQNTRGSYICKCNSGYALTGDKKTCEPVCFGQPIGKCQHGGTCLRPNSCQCPAGYATPDCADINECNNNNGGCSQICKNTVGSFHCSCSPGYGLVGTSDCKAICFGGPPGECPNEGKCLSPDRCSCKKGYAGSPCADMDECLSNNGGCSHNCKNTKGSYTCSCKANYELDSDRKTCKAICHGLPAGSCKHGGSCIEPDVCTCPAGYATPDCEDINECLTSNGGCEQLCENTEGSFLCNCTDGFQLSADRKTCEDFDECGAGTSGCSHFCVNDPGSYHCDCPLGYELGADKRACKDINECSRNSNSNGPCSQQCVNTDGSFECMCRDGFILDTDKTTCQDTSDCGNKQFVWCWPQCTPSGSSCTCPAGHVLHSNGQNCVDPCFNRPCENQGVCSKPSVDSTSFMCECDGTGYKGSNCEIGIISISDNARVRAGILSDSVVVTAFPEEEIILTAQTNNDVQVFPNQLFIRGTSTSVNFKVLAQRSGRFEVIFSISGKNAQSFPDAPSIVVLSDDVFSKYQIPFRGLPQGNFIIDITLGGVDYRFSSTSDWYRLGSDRNIFFTNGVTFSAVHNVSLPVSVKGLEVNTNGRLTIGPVSGLRIPSSGSVVSGPVVRRTRQAQFDLSFRDINDFIENNSLLRTLFAFLRPLLPPWLRFAIGNSTADPFFFAQISPGSSVQKLPYCAGAPLFDDTVYHVFRFTHAITLSILNEELYLPETHSEQYCIIVDLNKDYGSTLVVMFPDKAAQILKKISAFKKMQEDTGIVIYPNGFGISLFRKLNVEPIASELEFWNGDRMFNYPLSKTATFWVSLEVGKTIDSSKKFDFAIAPVPIETYVSLPDIRRVFTHVFIEPWEMYLRSIGEPLEITLYFQLLKNKYSLSFSTGNFVHHSLQAYGSVGGYQSRAYCGATANPPGIFTSVFVDGKLLRGLPIIQDLAFSIDLEAQAFYRLDDVDIGTVPRPIDIIKSLLNQIKTAANELLSFVITEIQKYVNLIAPVILTTIETFREHIKDLIAIVENFLQTFNLPALAVNLADLARDVMNSVRILVETVKKLVDQLKIMFVETIKDFVKFIKEKVEAIRKSAVEMVRNLYEKTVGIFKGPKTLGVRGLFSVTVFGLSIGVEGEFVQSDAHLRRCTDLADIYEHMQGEAAWRAFGVVDGFKIGLAPGRGTGKISKKIWSLLSVKIGFGFGLALASDSDNFVVRLHARLNFFGAKGAADLFVTNTGITSRTQVDIWDIFTARLTISATVFVDLADWSLRIRGEFIPGGVRKREAGNSVQASLGDAIRRFVTRLADEAVKRINQAQDAVNKAKDKLSQAQNWLEEKKSDIDKANKVFDRAIDKLEGAKRKLEAAKGPFKRALEKLKAAQKRVDGLCRIKTCKKICIPGIKFRKCGWFWCPKWTRCMIKIPNVFCIAKNVACRIIRVIAFLALEVAKFFVRIPMIALDIAKGALSVAQVIVDKARVVLDIAKLALDLAKGALQLAKGGLSVLNAALEVVKFAVRAVQYAINFIVKYGLQSIIDIGNCGFEIELSTRDLFEFEVFCDVNPFRLGWKTVRFRLNFRNIFGSIWNAAKSLVNSFLGSIKSLLGRRKREIDFVAFSRLHKAFRMRRQTTNGTFDESVFDSVDLNNNTVLTDTTKDSEIKFWEEQCARFNPVNKFLTRAFNELLNITYQMEEAFQEVSSRGSETIEILRSVSAQSVDDSEVDYNIALEDFNVTREEAEAALRNHALQEEDLIKESKGAAEYLAAQNEEAKDSFLKTEILPRWRGEMDNITDEYNLGDECSGFYDCLVWSFGELYLLVDSVDPNLIPSAKENLPLLEQKAYSLFENDSKTYAELKEVAEEIVNTMRLLSANDVFCASVPVLKTGPNNATASQGEDVILTCEVESVPAPTYYWYKNEELFSTGSSQGTLVLKAVDSEDEGEYVCYAGNHVTNATSDPATVTVVSAPKMLSDLPNRIELANGETLNVLCDVSAAPEAVKTWTLDSDQTFQLRNDTLYIPAVQLSNAGVYKCSASNVYGQVTSNDMTVDVLEATARCVTLSLEFAFLAGNADGLDLNETLVQEDLTGASLQDSFRQAAVLIINSSAPGLNVVVKMSRSSPSSGEIGLSTDCDPESLNCTDGDCSQEYLKANELLTSLIVRLQSVIMSDRPLFILDGLVYNFNPSVISIPDEVTNCPSGYREDADNKCVKLGDKVPQDLRIVRRIKFGKITTLIFTWDPPIAIANQQKYDVEVTNSRHQVVKKERVYFRSYGLLIQPEDGEVTVRVRTVLPEGVGPFAEMVIPEVEAGNKSNPIFVHQKALPGQRLTI